MKRLRYNAFLTVSLIAVLPQIAGAHDNRTVKFINVESPITPVSAEFIMKAIEQSEDEDAELLVVQLDTPGGLMSSMRQIIKAILASKVPVVVYVAPSGAQSGSAGVFINYASHISAMAPGTNIGAAHPVNIGVGADTSSVMEEKILNDATAYIRSLAQRRGRNEEWAELAVRESESVTATEALENNIIDLIAVDLEDLLEKVDGMQIDMDSGSIVLDTKNANIEEIDLGLRLKILGVIADPNIAYILMLLGLAGIGLELYNPGTLVPGIIGAISLVLAFYALQTLPVNFAGVLLILIAIVLFILEIKIPSYGLLSVAGVLCMALGSIMLIDTSLPYLQVSMNVIIPAVLITAALFLTAVGFGLKAQQGKPSTGKEGLIGETGVVKINIQKKGGQVLLHGELWKAFSDEVLKKGENVRVVAVNDLAVKVEKI